MSEESKEMQDLGAPDGAAPDWRTCSQCGANRLDDGVCSFLHCPDPTHDTRREDRAHAKWKERARLRNALPTEAPSGTESSEYLRGRERGIEEAARRWREALELQADGPRCVTEVGTLLWDAAHPDDPYKHDCPDCAPLRALLSAEPQATPPSPSREDLLGALRAALTRFDTWRVEAYGRARQASKGGADRLADAYDGKASAVKAWNRRCD